MDPILIGDSIKQSIVRITGIPPDQISDAASFHEDLGLDSLSMLEIAVDAEMSFAIKIPDSRLPEIRTVNDAVRIVTEYLPASPVQA